MFRSVLIVCLLALLTVFTGPVYASDQAKIQNSAQQVYGSQLMSAEERLQYHQQLRVLQTEQEKEQFRIQHHHKMQERAKALGKTLPEQPREGGYGYGYGDGAKQGGPGGKR